MPEHCTWHPLLTGGSRFHLPPYHSPLPPHTPQLPLVLLWLDWEAWPHVSTWPRLDSDPPTPPAPTPPSPAVTGGGTAESLAQRAQTHPQLPPETSQRVGRRSCPPWTLTSASWTPGEEISRQDYRESCQREEHQLREKVRRGWMRERPDERKITEGSR